MNITMFIPKGPETKSVAKSLQMGDLVIARNDIESLSEASLSSNLEMINTIKVTHALEIKF